MEVKNLFDPAVKKDIIARINKLNSQSKPQWGKMNVSQMMAHLQMPMGVAVGTHLLRRTIFGRIVGPFAKPMMYSEKPFKHNMPTDPSFIMTGTVKDFENEKQNLLKLIDSFREEKIVNEIHPFFGRMTKEQWSKSMYKHIDHHLQQFSV